MRDDTSSKLITDNKEEGEDNYRPSATLKDKRTIRGYSLHILKFRVSDIERTKFGLNGNIDFKGRSGVINALCSSLSTRLNDNAGGGSAQQGLEASEV